MSSERLLSSGLTIKRAFVGQEFSDLRGDLHFLSANEPLLEVRTPDHPVRTRRPAAMLLTSGEVRTRSHLWPVTLEDAHDRIVTAAPSLLGQLSLRATVDAYPVYTNFGTFICTDFETTNQDGLQAERQKIISVLNGYRRGIIADNWEDRKLDLTVAFVDTNGSDTDIDRAIDRALDIVDNHLPFEVIASEASFN